MYVLGGTAGGTANDGTVPPLWAECDLGCRPRLAWSDLAVGGGPLPASVAAVSRDTWPTSVTVDASVPITTPILAGADARAGGGGGVEIGFRSAANSSQALGPALGFRSLRGGVTVGDAVRGGVTVGDPELSSESDSSSTVGIR